MSVTPTLLSPDMAESLIARSAQVLSRLRQTEHKVVTAESCTGGLVAALLTHHAGSSDVTEGGFVTYSNALKNAVLGVSSHTLSRFGAVSAETVQEMVQGALRLAHNATVAVSVSGIAGPSGGSAEKPVGLVWFGVALKGQQPQAYSQVFTGNREAVRTQAAEYALALVLKNLPE